MTKYSSEELAPETAVTLPSTRREPIDRSAAMAARIGALTAILLGQAEDGKLRPVALKIIIEEMQVDLFSCDQEDENIFRSALKRLETKS